MYDSTQDTLNHIQIVKNHLAKFSKMLRVRAEVNQTQIVKKYLSEFYEVLRLRGEVHDQSKLKPPEKVLFDIWRPYLMQVSYPSEEYGEGLRHLQTALDHHYANNSHHPEYYKHQECGLCFRWYPEDRKYGKCDVCEYDIFEQKTGVEGMSMFDVIEMNIDWKAATENQKEGNIFTSILANKERFHITGQLTCILLNTANEMGWIDVSDPILPIKSAGVIENMNLFEIVGMYMNLKAEAEDQKEGDIFKIILANKERLHMTNQLTSILLNTAREMGWIDSNEPIVVVEPHHGYKAGTKNG